MIKDRVDKIQGKWRSHYFSICFYFSGWGNVEIDERKKVWVNVDNCKNEGICKIEGDDIDGVLGYR